jgi:topoisomerase-4 subunit A
LLVFPLDELKLQPGGGRGLTLMDVDTKAPLVALATFFQTLKVHGIALRGSKPREELLRGAALEAHTGRRARKGRVVAGLKPQWLEAVA